MTTKFTTQTAALAGRIGGLTNRSRHTPHEMTASAYQAIRERLAAEIDPTVGPDEFQARLEAATKAHMLRLTYKAAVKRSQAEDQAKKAAAAAEAGETK